MTSLIVTERLGEEGINSLTNLLVNTDAQPLAEYLADSVVLLGGKELRLPRLTLLRQLAVLSGGRVVVDYQTPNEPAYSQESKEQGSGLPLRRACCHTEH